MNIEFGNVETALDPKPGEWVYYDLTFLNGRYVAVPYKRTKCDPVREKAVLLPDDLWRFE